MRTRLVGFSFFAGVLVALTGLFLESLLRLAYEHNALSEYSMDFAASFLMTLGWPGLVLDHVGFSGATDFTHSHVQGSAFWESVASYIVVNSLGWWVSLYLLWIGAALILHRFRGRTVEIGSHQEPP